MVDAGNEFGPGTAYGKSCYSLESESVCQSLYRGFTVNPKQSGLAPIWKPKTSKIKLETHKKADKNGFAGVQISEVSILL